MSNEANLEELRGEDLEACKRQFLSYLKQRAWNWADKLAALEVP